MKSSSKWYQKFSGYNLPRRKTPLKIPYKGLDAEQVPFQGSWLLQVIEKKNDIADKQIKERGFQSYGWGAGTSGLNVKELKELNKIFQFEYMGASEYEGGNLGESYRYLISHYKELVFNEFNIFNTKFYVVSLNYHVPFLEKTLTAIIANNQFPVRISKEEIKLHRVVQGENPNFIGAWNLDSHFVFFTNKARFLRFKKLLKSQCTQS